MINYYTAEGQRAAELASIDVEKNRDKACFMAEIEVQKQQKLEEIRYNRQLKKEGVVHVLEQAEDGFWEVNTKIFENSQYRCRFSDLRNVVVRWLKPVDKQGQEKVFVIEFSVGNIDDRKQCFFSEDELTAKQVQKKLMQAGVHFWVKDRMKKELLEAFIASACQIAETIEIPRKHGWYRSEKIWYYAGKRHLTWKEVEKRVK